MASLLNPELLAAASSDDSAQRVAGTPGVLQKPHHKPTARRIIYLFMSGAPSQIDLFDYKPKMQDMFERRSARHGPHGPASDDDDLRAETVPHCAVDVQVPAAWPVGGLGERVVCPTRPRSSMTCASSNQSTPKPSTTTRQSPTSRPAASFPAGLAWGAWLSYGLGSMNRDLPAFVVLHSTWSAKRDAQALYSRLWGSGFLPSRHQGVSLRSSGDPVLYLSNPAGVDPFGPSPHARHPGAS